MKNQNSNTKVQKTAGRKLPVSTSPLSISTIGSSHSVVIGEIVAALKAKNSKKLLSLTGREFKAENFNAGLFAVLCWFYLLSNLEHDGKNEEENEREPWEHSEKRTSFLESVKKSCEYFNELYLKNGSQADTSFFEKEPREFFAGLMKMISAPLLEHFQLLFISHGGAYHIDADDRFIPVRNVMGAFLAMFADNRLVTESDIDKIGRQLGQKFLDDAMMYVFERESILNPLKRKAYNQAMRLVMYQYFMHLFAGNYFFHLKVRTYLQERLAAWINVETYIKANLDALRKEGPRLYKRLPNLVDVIQGLKTKEPVRVWNTIESQIRVPDQKK